MVRMEMGADDPGDRPSRQRTGEHRLPGIPRGRHVEAGVDDRDALAIVQQPQIDMVERAGHRRARPADAVGQLQHRAIIRPGAAQRVGQAPVRIRRVDHQRVAAFSGQHNHGGSAGGESFK